MKKKVLAVLVAVCMIAGTCVLFASAASFAVGDYVEKVNASGSLLADNLKKVTKGTDFEIPVTAEAKSNIELNTGTKEVTASNVDSLVTFKKGTSTLTFSKDLANYYNVIGTISGDTATISFNSKDANKVDVYKVTTAIDATDTDVSAKLTAESAAEKYSLSPASLTATVSKWTNKLSSVTMGVRFFGSTYDNLVAAEIAKVTANVNRKSGATTTVNTSVTNVIKDLMIGDEVTLTASLKDDAEKEFYGFYCWVDGSGNVLSTSQTITHTVTGNDVAFYATYVELKDRFTVDYSSNGNGKVIYNEGREVFNGDAQISVLGGRDATFTFVPDEGYEVAKVVIDGKLDVASFKSIDLTKLLTGDLSSLKNLINATNKDTYCYTFPKVAADHSIEVTFSPIENFEAPEGVDLPTVEAEGITLATGAAGEGGEGGADGTTVPAENGAAGNGGSAVGGVVNPATGSKSAVAVFAVLSAAAAVAFVALKKKNKED